MITFKDHIKETLYLKAKKRVDEMGIKESLNEGAKSSYVSFIQAADDIIWENKRVAKVLERRDAMARDWHKEKKVAEQFKKEVAMLEKSLAASAKIARAFWESWGEEF